MTRRPEPGQRLSPREAECIALRAAGLNPSQVADKLYIEKRTVDFHCQNAYYKLEVHNIIQAIKALRQQGVSL